MEKTSVFKKAGVTLLVWAVILLFSPLLLAAAVCALLYTPIDYIGFKRSRYQKDFPRRYSWLCGCHIDNKAYTAIRESALPIEYSKPEDDYEQAGYFFYRDVLLLFDMSVFFDSERGELRLLSCDPDEEGSANEEEDTLDEADGADYGLTVEEARARFFEDAHRNVSGCACSRVVFFFDENLVRKQHGLDALAHMREQQDFILYKRGKLRDALAEFVARV